MNPELPDGHAGFRKKQRNQKSNFQYLLDHWKRKFQKNIYFCFIDYAKAFVCVDHNKLWKFFKRWKYQTTWPASWESCMQVKKQQLELDMKQQTGFKLGKEYVKVVLSPCLFNLHAEFHHEKCRAGWSTSWNLDCREKYQLPQICRWHHPYGRKWRGTIEPLDKGERREWEKLA